MVVYSICDRKSFQAAQCYLNIINKIKGISTIKVPIVLLGNKRDLEVGRQVGLEEGRSVAIKYDCQFFEVKMIIVHKLESDSNSYRYQPPRTTSG